MSILEKGSATLSVSRLASLGSAFVLAYINVKLVSIILYRFFFHPLAKYPGPLLSRITDWYSIYHIVKGDAHINFYRLHEKHGPVVRYGPNRISFNSVDALKTIYSSYGHKAKIVKADYYTVVGHHFGALNLVSIDDPAEHSRKRRIMAQALTTSAVKSMHPSIWKNLASLFDSLRPTKSATWSAPVDMTRLSNAFAFDTMAEIVFGRNLGMLTSHTNRWILSVLPEAVKFLHIMGHMPRLLLLDYLPFKSQMAKDMDSYLALSQREALERIQRGPNPSNNSNAKDVFSHLLGAKDPETGGPGMNEEELIAEAGVLMIAGSDTTALAITSTLFYIAKHPTVQQRLRTELRDTFTDPELMKSWTMLSSCGYLRACLNEAMRLVPAVAGVLPRTILSPGLTISGEYFPPGTIVGVSSYTIHHNVEYFPEPFKFKPERWINENQDNDSGVQRTHEAFFGFSQGPRGCVGKHLAYTEMSMAVAYIVWHLEIQLANELDGEVETRKNIPDWVSEMRARGELATSDMFVSHPIDGPFLKFCEWTAV